MAVVIPDSWVTTYTETVPGPVDIGQSTPRSYFARITTVVHEGGPDGPFLAASGDRQDAVNQAVAILEARQS